MSKTLNRDCSVCGASLQVFVSDNGTYTGGHYWADLLDDGEYWECDSCYRDDDGHDELAPSNG